MHRCAFETFEYTFEIMGDTRYIWVILSACAGIHRIQASYWIGACLRVDKAVIQFYIVLHQISHTDVAIRTNQKKYVHRVHLEDALRVIDLSR